MRAGYSFAGWTPEVAEFVTENVVYTATWTINDYTITFDARGGEVSPAEITVTYGQPVGTLPVPTREGFDFIGWFDENGTRYTDETVYLVDGNITLNARWSMTAYTVTFVDSLNNNAVIGTLTVGRGDVIDSGEFPAAPEHQGYVFCGWDYDGEPVMNDMTVSTVYHCSEMSIWTAASVALMLLWCFVKRWALLNSPRISAALPMSISTVR